MQKNIIYISILTILLGCASPKPITSNVNPTMVQKLGVIPNVSIITDVTQDYSDVVI